VANMATDSPIRLMATARAAVNRSPNQSTALSRPKAGIRFTMTAEALGRTGPVSFRLCRVAAGGAPSRLESCRGVEDYGEGMCPANPTHEAVTGATAATEEAMQPQSVPVNVYETSKALVIVAPLPAVAPSDVTVELRPGAVRFWARLRSSGTREYLVHEWEYGCYEREIALPIGWGGGVEASLANGQLVVRVAHGEPSGPVTIQPNPVHLGA
jgi:HSP20 family molecular chaperone IbpA